MKSKRVVYFDLLNILAIISVIALHHNGIVHSNPNVRAWGTSLIVECICYFAVPIFIMLSGANLLTYREKYDTKTFFKKRFSKILIPFAFWATFMFIWKICTGQLVINYTFKEIINSIFSNREESIYYFIWLILGLYLTIPYLSLTAKKENKNTIILTIILYFIFNSIFCGVLPLFGINYNFDFSVQLGGYVIYLLLGYIIANFDINKKTRVLIYVLAVIGLIYRFSTTYYLSKSLGYVYNKNWGYLSWHCFLLSSAVFLFIKNMNLAKITKRKKMCNILKEISSCSFGIYFIHLIVKYYEIVLFNISEYSWIFRTFGVLLTYFISLIVVYILKKVPILNKIVP